MRNTSCLGQEMDVVEEGNSCTMLYPRVLLHILHGIRVLIILFSSHICLNFSISLVLSMFLSTSDILFSVLSPFQFFFVLSWLLFLGSTVWFKIAYKFCYTVSNIYIYMFSVLKRGRRRCDTQYADCGF